MKKQARESLPFQKQTPRKAWSALVSPKCPITRQWLRVAAHNSYVKTRSKLKALLSPYHALPINDNPCGLHVTWVAPTILLHPMVLLCFRGNEMIRPDRQIGNHSFQCGRLRYVPTLSPKCKDNCLNCAVHMTNTLAALSKFMHFEFDTLLQTLPFTILPQKKKK